MTSCSWISNISKSSIFATEYHAYLLTKNPVSFDKKFGYEVLVYKFSKDLSKLIVDKVFIPENIYKELPAPNNNIVVDIEYIESIDYSESSNSDFNINTRYLVLNLCVGYIIQTK